MGINNIQQVSYELITLEDERLFRRWPSGNWQVNVWSEIVGAWEWQAISITDSLAVELEDKYQGVIGDQIRNQAMKNNEGLE